MEQHAIDPADLDAILRRAVEIQQSQGLASDATLNTQELLIAAEEAGISRVAVEAALRERTAQIQDVLQSGELVFAKSGDGYFYVARLLEGDTVTSRVRFFSGAETTIPSRDLRPFRPVPGEKVIANISSFGGWYQASILAFYPEAMTVSVSCWGTTDTVPLVHIRLPREKKTGRDMIGSWGSWLAVAGVSLAAGGVIGSLVTWLLMR